MREREGGVRANLDAAGGGDLSNFSFGEAHFRTSLPDNYCTVPKLQVKEFLKKIPGEEAQMETLGLII